MKILDNISNEMLTLSV